MNEEQQLALAFMVSARDADAKYTEAQSDGELLKKAPKESVQTHSPEKSWVGDELTQTVTGSNLGDCVTTVCSKHTPGDALSPDGVESQSTHGLTELDRSDHVLSPLVILEKLSEEVVRCSQESSIVLSPEKELSLSSRSPVRNLKPWNNCYPSLNISPCRCVDNSRGSKEQSPNQAEKDWRVVPSQRSVQKSELSTKSASDQERVAQHFSSAETKLLEVQEEGDCSGSHQFEVENLRLALSAVNDWRRRELHASEQLCIQSEGSASSKSNSLGGHMTDGGGLVNYFWGIPFCPSGLDPDQYTRVILCQLETYEKCLKQAQSQLLRKLEFGPPVLPAPVPREAQRARRGQQAPEQSITMSNQDQESDRENEQEVERQEEQSPPERSSDGEESTEEAQIGSDEVERCLVDGNSQEKSSDLFVEETPEEEENGKSCPSDRVESEDSRGIGSSEGGIQPEDDVLFVCAETQQSSSEDVQFKSKNPQRSDTVTAQEPADVVLIEDDSEELHPVISKKACVECPLCGQRFSLEKIEVHAADCNGTSDRDGQWQVRTRSKPRRAGKQNGTDGSNASIFNQ
ncbi:uncharacterized protein uimc1 isoform X2 [Cetorhinus maximus]